MLEIKSSNWKKILPVNRFLKYFLEQPRKYGVSNSNKIERSIIYSKDATEAKGILHAWRLMDKEGSYIK